MTSRDADPAILVEGLVKQYGGRRVVDGISFRVPSGEIFALLGPNGAGKTTTVEILEGYRIQDAGRVRVLGLDPRRQSSALKARIGVLLQDPGLYLTITPREALDLFASFYPRPRSIDELLHLVGLEGAATTRYRRLSGGQKKRLGLALSLVGSPEVLFLDEPTASLDAQARRAVWEVIRDMRDSGVAVLLTTHYLEEAERLADRVAILSGGTIQMEGSPHQLTGHATNVVQLRTGAEVSPGILKALPHAGRIKGEGLSFRVETADAPSLLVEITSELRAIGVPIVELRVGDESLEDVFLRLTGAEVAL